MGAPKLVDTSIARLPMGIPRDTTIIRNINVTNLEKITGPRTARHTQVGMNMDMSRTHPRGEMITMVTAMSLGTIVHRPTVGDGKNTVSTDPGLGKGMVQIDIHVRKRRHTRPNMEGTVDTLNCTSPVTAARLTVMVMREVSMEDMKGVNRNILLVMVAIGVMIAMAPTAVMAVDSRTVRRSIVGDTSAMITSNPMDMAAVVNDVMNMDTDKTVDVTMDMSRVTAVNETMTVMSDAMDMGKHMMVADTMGTNKATVVVSAPRGMDTATVMDMEDRAMVEVMGINGAMATGTPLTNSSQAG